MIDTISYWFYDAITGMKKNKKNFFISTGTMLITMIIIAITFSVIKNAAVIAKKQEEAQSKISFYLDPSVTDEQVEILKSQFENIDKVTSIEYVTSEEGIKRATELNPVLTEGFESEDLASFFPPYFKIGFSEIGADEIIINRIAVSNEKNGGIQDVAVSDSAEKAIRKAKITQILSTVLLMIIIELSVVLIMNSTKLMLYAQRKEISIMKYVGATDKFIKVPFIMQGVMIALVAVAITLVAVFFLYSPIISAVGNSVGVKLLERGEILPALSLILLLIAVGIGVIGSSASMNKYLDV